MSGIKKLQKQNKKDDQEKILDVQMMEDQCKESEKRIARTQ